MLAEKELVLEEIKKKIDPTLGCSFILTSYNQLTSNQCAQFREALVSAGGDFFALKRRIFLKAAEAHELGFELKELKGHIGIVLGGENFVSATKALYGFKKENKDKIEILGGHFEGSKCSPDEVEQLSKLPSMDEMRAQFVGLIAAPMTSTLGVFQALLTSVLFAMDNKAKKES